MADLTIHDLDDEIIERLKTKARENGRSLDAELRVELTAAAYRPASRKRLSRKEAREFAERITAMTPDVPQTDSVKLSREDRDR